MERKKIARYLLSLGVILVMVGMAERTGEKEILFPEMVALAIGLLIVDKRVWNVRRWQIVLLMSLGAVAGICIVRFSPFLYPVNLCLALIFAIVALLVSRTTLIPLISACVLPVLLYTESWVYPMAVFLLSLLSVLGQKVLEMRGFRARATDLRMKRPERGDVLRWLALFGCVGLISTAALSSGYSYVILPPLIVTFAEMVHSKSGFRNRPVQVFLFLVTAATLGAVFQLVGYYYYHLPQTAVAFCIAVALFLVFEWTGKYFAPAGALAFIPMLLPAGGLFWLPLQVAVGAALFIAIAMVAFHKCYKWNRAQLVYCFIPSLLREYRFAGRGRK